MYQVMGKRTSRGYLLTSLLILAFGFIFTLIPVFSEVGVHTSKYDNIGTVFLVAGTIIFGVSVGFKTRNDKVDHN